MKLVFPGGEHPQVLLGPGVNRVGSGPDANIVLDRPGVQPRHCELHVGSAGVTLQVPAGAQVRVNGRSVDGLIALRPGDSVAFERIEARLASLDAGALATHRARPADVPVNDDPQATAVQPVLPRYVLRGVSGAGFGRTFPLVGPALVGRAPDCAIRLDLPGISRQHARLTPTASGLLVEDLGSTNGTLRNEQRIQRAFAAHGDELGFGSMRFRVVVPGNGEPVEVAARSVAARAPRRWSPWWLVAVAVALLAAIWGVALLR